MIRSTYFGSCNNEFNDAAIFFTYNQPAFMFDCLQNVGHKVGTHFIDNNACYIAWLLWAAYAGIIDSCGESALAVAFCFFDCMVRTIPLSLDQRL